MAVGVGGQGQFRWDIEAMVRIGFLLHGSPSILLTLPELLLKHF